ncbi:MAG: 50S ribosomal protein L6 [Chloroflexota bacterium]|nr:50S ribosomal protein L6 [Chloroflexota bacterium]
MSRIGRKPIPVPEGVRVEIENNCVTVEGPRGKLSKSFHPDMNIALVDGQIVVTRPTDERDHRALHGLTRALLANMVTGVTEGYRKRLEIHGIGYRAEMKGDNLILHVGFSHSVEIEPPPGINFVVEKRYKTFVVEGNDKELVGDVAAKIRAVRKPEPYKGKGIRYEGEWVRHKAGKAGKIGAVIGG